MRSSLRRVLQRQQLHIHQRRWSCSNPGRGIMLRGFLAGIHSFGPDNEYATFDEAYDAICGVDEEVLEDFANDMDQTIIHGSRLVSVFDIPQGNNVVMRHLFLNQRPHLVQTTVQVDAVGGSLCKVGAPPPLSETHFGGLALALKFWNGARRGNTYSCSCVVLGAGGCSLAATMSAYLIRKSSSKRLVAVEPCLEIQDAAKKWFGAANGDFDLVSGFGEEYLNSVPLSSIDVLIVDAEDGTAPPQSMQTEDFWRHTVLPKLADNAVVGINMIGEPEEREVLQLRLKSIFPDDYCVLTINPPKEALIKSDRHSLLFCYPTSNSSTVYWGDDLHDLVSNPDAWLQVINGI